MAAACNNMTSASRSMDQSKIFAQIARRHARELLAAAIQLTHDSEDASDLLQDAFERALRCNPDVGPDTAICWILTVMRNLFIDRCRQQSCRLRVLRALHANPEVISYHPEETSPKLARLTPEQVANAVTQLKTPFREVFELSARDMSLSQISKVLGIRTATAGTRLFRARRKLRAILAFAQEFGHTVSVESGV